MRWAAEEWVVDLHSSIETPDSRVGEASDDGVQDEGKDLEGRAGRPPSDPGAPTGPPPSKALSGAGTHPPMEAEGGPPVQGQASQPFPPGRPSCPFAHMPLLHLQRQVGDQASDPKAHQQHVGESESPGGIADLLDLAVPRSLLLLTPAGGRKGLTGWLPSSPSPRAQEGSFPALRSSAC